MGKTASKPKTVSDHQPDDAGMSDMQLHPISNFPKFNRDKHDLVLFANDFHKVTSSMTSNDTKLNVETLKSLFASLFENEDRALYDNIPTDLKTNNDWNAYLDALLDVFPPPHKVRAARYEFIGLAQEYDESVLSFRNQIERVARLAHPYNPQIRISEILSVFIHGLRSSIRDRILDYELETMDAAFRLAQKFELIYDSHLQNSHDDVDNLSHQVNALSMKSVEMPRKRKESPSSSLNSQSQGNA